MPTRKRFTCPQCRGQLYTRGRVDGVDMLSCASTRDGRVCAFRCPSATEERYFTEERPESERQRLSDEDTDVIDDRSAVDDLTAVMRDVSNELRRIAETGRYKGFFIDPVVERAAQAIKKLHEEVVELRKRAR